MQGTKLIVGITQGDGNGIGYEVIIKALGDPRILDSFTPVVYGSSKIFGFYRKSLHNIEQVDTYVISNVRDAKPKKINILNCLPDNVYVEPGKASGESAKAAINSLKFTRSPISGFVRPLLDTASNRRTIVVTDVAQAGMISNIHISAA